MPTPVRGNRGVSALVMALASARARDTSSLPHDRFVELAAEHSGKSPRDVERVLERGKELQRLDPHAAYGALNSFLSHRIKILIRIAHIPDAAWQRLVVHTMVKNQPMGYDLLESLEKQYGLNRHPRKAGE